MKRTHWIILAVMVVAGAAGAWYFTGKKKTAETEYRTAIVEKGDIRQTVRASGTLQAVTTVQVGTQVSGIIKKIYVDFNSVVREGQVIAVLDTILLAQAVEDSRVAMKKAEIQENQARREFERTKQLFEQKVMAQADYDLALTTFETAQANVISSQSALNRAKINLKYATIIAPISGVVVSRAVDVGQTVAASFSTPTMFTIANDLTKMQVEANIDEGDIGKIAVGQSVTFSVDAYPDLTFEGTVRQVRLQPVVSQTVVNYTVIIDVPNPDLKLLPGMTANITVLVKEAKDVLKIPSAALRFTPPQEIVDAMVKKVPDSVKMKRERRGGWQGGRRGGQEGDGGGFGMVWVKTGDSLKPHRVRTGISDGLNIEVRGRIEEGEEVVLSMTSSQNNPAATQQQQQNPFAPQMPRGGRGGR